MGISSPALSPDGATLYFGSSDEKVYALRTSTGEEQWTFTTGDNKNHYLIRDSLHVAYSSPVLSPDGATLYIGSHHHTKHYSVDKKVYALRTSTTS